MIEAGGSKEAETVDICGKTHPHALLVALGRPQNPDDFYDVIEIPICIEALKRSKFLQLLEDGSKLARSNQPSYQREIIQL